ncbi:MAG: hypothetical protein U9R46_09895 [Bacteroidota bacterium]|nr:hypothetical protein [Bacteroidota bacterium]
MSNKTVFRIRELIYLKYGEAKLATACIIIAQWVNYECRDLKDPHIRFIPWKDTTVLMLCQQCGQNFPMLPQEAEALRKLFGLKSIEEIFHQPNL